MLPLAHKKYEIMVTRKMMQPGVKITILHLRKYKVIAAFKKLDILEFIKNMKFAC